MDIGETVGEMISDTRRESESGTEVIPFSDEITDEVVPDGEPDAVHLYLDEGLGLKRIAKAVGITPRAVKTRLQRAGVYRGSNPGDEEGSAAEEAPATKIAYFTHPWEFTSSHQVSGTADKLRVRFQDYDYMVRPLPVECFGKRVRVKVGLRGYDAAAMVGVQTADGEWVRQRVLLTQFAQIQTVGLVVDIGVDGGHVKLRAEHNTIVVESAQIELVTEDSVPQ